MEEIVCKNCGLVDDYSTEMKSGQNVATCNGCGNYIKNLPQGNPPQIYIGKYKGQFLHDITDTEYLIWAYKNWTMNPKMKNDILNRITELGGKI